MQNTEWVIIDTETTGLASPIFVVELAAQRMQGWAPIGPPFRYLVNHGRAIPPEASRVHGYTREILERDGEEPNSVYQAFARYVGSRPIASYNLAYDWDQVLMPEWERLGLAPSGERGLCLMRLAQRLLDPVPAGNCKLQTLRQYYNLPARGAHTALGDVETVIDLAQRVLHPLAEQRRLADWAALLRFTEGTWFPARIPFGKFKGRHFRDARHDDALYGWLEWLSESSNERSAAMGEWYLDHLDDEVLEMGAESSVCVESASTETGIVIFNHPDAERLRMLISAARNRLAELETDYTRVRRLVVSTQNKLFALLRPYFQKRDQLKLRLCFRKKYLETLLTSGDEEAEEVSNQFEHAREQTDSEYDRIANESNERADLSEDEEAELKSLWRKLVRLFHPDRFVGDKKQQQAYEQLTAEINRARDAGDIQRLREIAENPEAFISRQGWGELSLEDAEGIEQLTHLLESLNGQIISLLDAQSELLASNGYELHKLISDQPHVLAEIATEQIAAIEEEARGVEFELDRLEQEIEAMQA